MNCQYIYFIDKRSGSSSVKWSADGKRFVPKEFAFTGTPGLQGAAAALPKDAHPADFFELLLTDALLERIVVETNLYAEYRLSKVRTEALQGRHGYRLHVNVDF